MSSSDERQLARILRAHAPDILTEWIQNQRKASIRRRDLISESDLNEQSQQFFEVFCEAAQHDNLSDITTSEWGPVRRLLDQLSQRHAEQGFSPSETAAFVFSLKESVFVTLRLELQQTPQSLLDLIVMSSELLDKLGLYVTELHQRNRESVIMRQQQELLELSTPVVKLWEGILAVPLIGTLDSARTQIVMENLLETIVKESAPIAIIDITGVPTVDTLVAQHLLQTVAAARLMGADCFISGVRPQIAQTIVHLGLDLSAITTKATLADAFRLALQQQRWHFARSTPRLES
jgi:rsbT co-antagonist protein RsbR